LRLSYFGINGLIEESYLFESKQLGLRSLTREREKLISFRTSLSNSLESFLVFNSLVFIYEMRVGTRICMVLLRMIVSGEKDLLEYERISGLDSSFFNAITYLDETILYVLEGKLDMYLHVSDTVCSTERIILAYCEKFYEKDYEFLTSISGIGSTAASVFLGEIGGSKEILDRFPESIRLYKRTDKIEEQQLKKIKTEKKIASYAGLAPDKRTSGGKELPRHVSKGNRHINTIFIQCGQTILRGKTELGTWGRQLAQSINASNKRKGNGKKGSVVKTNKGYSVGVRAVARKTIVHCVNVLLKQQPFSDKQYNFKVRQNVATGALTRVVNQLEVISESIDINSSDNTNDAEMQQALAQVTNKLNEISGIKYRYLPTEKLAICDLEPIENLELPKRVVTVLMNNGITTIGSLFLKFTTTSILGVSGIGEMALKSIKKSFVEQGFILDMRKSPDG
jgi:hypothetical protein